jgi:5'-nucleotidase
MNILVTNDDGISSPGVWALAEAMSRVGDTLLVAPNKQQSGVGTAFSLHGGMSIEEVPSEIPNVRAYAVGGTPSDCVVLGLRQLGEGRRFDLVASGINLGANVGRDIHYSGTVMATLQGYFRNIPTLAMSLALRDRERPSFEVAKQVAEQIALGIRAGEMPTGYILNTNVPDVPLEEIRGVAVTQTAAGGYVQLARVTDSDGGVSYKQSTTTQEHPAGTDIWAVSSNLVSITPLQLEVNLHDGHADLTQPARNLEAALLAKRL